VDLEIAVRFKIEVAKAFRSWECSFYNGKQSDWLGAQYHSLERLQPQGLGHRG
jgi:hypothetical protein